MVRYHPTHDAAVRELLADPRAVRTAPGSRLMRLTASNLACRRGGREVFAGVSFSVASGEALGDPRPQWRGQNPPSCAWSLGSCAWPTASSRSKAGDPELTIGEQAHYLGHQDALKPSLSVRENLQFWADFLGTGAAAIGEPLASGRARNARRPARRLSLGGPAPPPLDRPPPRRHAPDLAAR